MNKKDFGKYGELTAKIFLEKSGYEYIESNFRTPYGEIDLICKDGDILVFIEVKARHLNNLTDIENSIDKRKINRIYKSAETYINKSKVLFKEIRIDAVFIEKNNKDTNIKLVKNFV